MPKGPDALHPIESAGRGVLLLGGDALGADRAAQCLALLRLPPETGMRRVPLHELARNVLAPGPAVILSPLVWAEGDAVDTARLLRATGYDGAYRVICPPLPRPQVVAAEIRSAAPGLDTALLTLPD